MSVIGQGSNAFVRLREGVAPESVFPSIRRGLRQFDSEMVVDGMQPMQQIVSDSIARQRFAMMLFSIFAAGALLLAGLGAGAGTHSADVGHAVWRETDRPADVCVGGGVAVCRRVAGLLSAGQTRGRSGSCAGVAGGVTSQLTHGTGMPHPRRPTLATGWVSSHDATRPQPPAAAAKCLCPVAESKEDSPWANTGGSPDRLGRWAPATSSTPSPFPASLSGCKASASRRN